MLMRRGRESVKTIVKTGLAALALALSGLGAHADEAAPAAPPDEGMVRTLAKQVETFHASKIPTTRTIAKKIGIATDPPEPADFVVNTRPTGEQDFIPIGRTETEHPIKVKTPAQLKAMENVFDGVKTRHDAFRSTFAPAVKAVADAKATQAAKAAKKHTGTPAVAQTPAAAQ
jgi:hypothetical protein